MTPTSIAGPKKRLGRASGSLQNFLTHSVHVNRPLGAPLGRVGRLFDTRTCRCWWTENTCHSFHEYCSTCARLLGCQTFFLQSVEVKVQTVHSQHAWNHHCASVALFYLHNTHSLHPKKNSDEKVVCQLQLSMAMLILRNADAARMRVFETAQCATPQSPHDGDLRITAQKG